MPNTNSAEISPRSIDPTVKIFGPTVDPEKQASLLDKSEEIIARNRSEEGRESAGRIMSAEQMLALLLTRVPSAMRGQVRIQLAGDEATGGGESDGEGEAAECAVM